MHLIATALKWHLFYGCSECFFCLVKNGIMINALYEGVKIIAGVVTDVCLIFLQLSIKVIVK